MRYFYLMLAAIIVAPISATGPALAAAPGYEIMTSSTDKLKPGQTFPAGARINLPDGSKITFIDTTGGTGVQKSCIGPYDGPISTCKGPKKLSFWCRLTGSCNKSGAVVGGQRSIRKDRPVVGGTRGMIRKPAPKE